MLYLQVLLYVGSLLLLSYPYLQLISDIYRPALVLGKFITFANTTYKLPEDGAGATGTC